MNKTWLIPRRTFLRGLGTCIALPMLEAMSPPVRLLAEGLPETAGPFPRRLVFVYVPNGVNMEDWTPATSGTEFELPMILEPLKPFRGDLQVLTGLAHDKARPHGDGPGDHARASATFLTGCHPRKTAGADIKVGISADQIAAEQLGHRTRLKSLELGCDRARLSGNCDSGYSCAYSYNIAWKTESTPLPPEVDPRQVFDRLFSDGLGNEVGENRAWRARLRKSILDTAREDATQLRGRLGAQDRRKLDEYLTAVRELELRVEQAEKIATAQPGFLKPATAPAAFEEHSRLMFDLLALALQTDNTRIATFLVSYDGSNRSYPNIGVSDGHHNISHHGNDAAKKAAIAKINQFHASLFAHFLGRLKTVKEGDGTLLDNCMIVYGSGISDGNRHNHDNLPILLAGGGGGALTPGRHVTLEKETPMTNLYLSLLDRLGAKAERIGDSTGRLEHL